MTRKLAIVPAYNEEACVARVVSAIHEHSPGFDVLVIDDGSTDSTGRCAERAGAAVQSGFQYAARHGYEIAAQVDADGQHDPRYLSHLVNRLCGDEEVDMVWGSRFQEEAGYKVPFMRRTGIMLFSGLMSAIVRQRVTDPTSGFRMTNRRGIELFARDYPHDYPEVEAILMMHAHRLRMSEVPVRMSERLGGRSSITNPLSAYYMVKVLLAVLVGLFRGRPAIEPGSEAPVSAQRGI
jgi:glycosyltransferase involved in cell wall biosynthesis